MKSVQRKISLPTGYNYIGIFLTLACPRNCSYCLNGSSNVLRKRPLTKGDKWIAALNRLRTDIPLTFNGGEPLLHPDFFDIINGLDQRFKVDILTTLPFDVREFIENVEPVRFERELPYSAIRVTFHPETMDLEETIGKVKTIKEAHFDVAINLVDHPHLKRETEEITKIIIKNGLDYVIKPFLGYLDGKLYGQYKYVDSCSMKFRRKVKCKTSNLLIDPLGNIYRCHRDLFSQNPEGVLGDIFDDKINNLLEKYSSCNNFGFCHPCDVQIKFDRFGKWGYSVVDIICPEAKVINESTVDWR